MKLNFLWKPKHIEKVPKINKKKEIILICILLIIGVTFFTGVSMGKAIHNANIQSNTKIAKPILEVEKGSEITITQDNKTGEYHFTVKNYNQAEEISQVDLKYYIEILENHLDNAIQYQLYKGTEEVSLIENKTEEMTLPKDEKEEQTYTLKVTYDESKNTVEDIMQDIQIKVHSEQLKI